MIMRAYKPAEYDVDTGVLSSLMAMTHVEMRIADRNMPHDEMMGKIRTELLYIRELERIMVDRLRSLEADKRLPA